ncbi:MAG: tetraacyldisaccharide 4'-kinase [Acidobacteriia bacterium]|nr:tetraacyldisaccharide 4'-kinase [Terriglobia bacterium]
MKTKGIYFLYRSFQAFGLPLIVLYFLWRGLRNRAYWKSFRERLGFLPHHLQQTSPGAIWLHAVSVGEVLALTELLQKIRRELPSTRFFVSTSTVAGRKLAEEKLAVFTEGVFYAPVDYVWAVRRVLRTLRPSLVAIAETEIWPNLFREVKRTGAALAIVNGRISNRAMPRYQRWRPAFQRVLPVVDCILAQTSEMAERFRSLGALPGRVHTAGNLKHDFEPRPTSAESAVARFLQGLPPRQVWIAASTMPGAFPGDVDEDDAVLAAFRLLIPRYPDLLLILAPRKPEQFEAAARKIEAAGLRYWRRSHVAEDSPRHRLPAVLLLDSIGELGGLFYAADVVFIGGTLAHRGGHNVLEPAFFAKPVIVGPHMENFQAVADEFRAAKAVIEIERAAELAEAVDRLLGDAGARGEIGRRALACAESKRGAVDRTVAYLRKLYGLHIPEFRPAQPWFALGWAQEQLWIWGARRRVKSNLSKPVRRRLPIPAISVGNITMGGTGKTPCVLLLAEHLRERGWNPGILTRGYGRRSPEKQLLLAAGACASPERTGDEPQLFLRSSFAPVGIGKDRFQTGTALASKFGIDIALLDDGFQHVRLAREIDIVLVDGLNPFGGKRVFPLGRLREPLEALSRASVFLITRSDATDLAVPIEHELRRSNPRAPIFRARVEPTAWVESGNGARHPVSNRAAERVAAFCGLGNPESFRRTLTALGVQLADWLEFDDHHRYRASEMRHIRSLALARGASAVVTTAKDAVNLCEGAGEAMAPLPLYWLDIELVIEKESLFLDYLWKRLGVKGAPARGER